MTNAPVVAEKQRVGAEELAVGLRMLADLFESGLPLTRVLQTFRLVAPPAWRAAAPGLLQAVREGRGLARALEESPLDVPPLVVGLVRAGESGTGLAHAVRQAAEYAEGVATTRATIRAALAYPALVALVGAGALALLLIVVLPRFERALADIGQALPPATQALLAASTALRSFGPWGAGVLILTFGWLRWYGTTPDGRRIIHSALLHLPVVGPIRRAGATARFASALGAMLESGVALRSALRQVRVSVGDEEIVARIDAARARVDAGESLSRTLETSGAVTPGAARLIAAGEEAGRLPAMLAFATRMERTHSERRMRGAVQLIEPALILFFAAVVALVAAAMLQAIYAVRPT